jgi:hypothetical protein
MWIAVGALDLDSLCIRAAGPRKCHTMANLWSVAGKIIKCPRFIYGAARHVAFCPFEGIKVNIPLVLVGMGHSRLNYPRQENDK